MDLSLKHLSLGKRGTFSSPISISMGIALALILSLALFHYSPATSTLTQTAKIKISQIESTLPSLPSLIPNVSPSPPLDNLNTTSSDANTIDDTIDGSGGTDNNNPKSNPSMMNDKPEDPVKNKNKDQDLLDKNLIYSDGTIFGSMDRGGEMTRQYYKLTNVELTTNDTLTFFYKPGFKPPTDQWVNTIALNATKPTLPTVITDDRTDLAGGNQYLFIRYVPATKKNQPQCKEWIEKPTNLAQIRFSENVWHAWTEGLTSAFQTFREQGHLPLVRIDAAGNIEEYTDDLHGDCVWVFDDATQTFIEDTDSYACKERMGNTKPIWAINTTACDPATETWCTPGVASYNKTHGPLLLAFKSTYYVSQWKHMFKAITEDLQYWSSGHGACFRELYLGHSNALSYHLTLPVPGDPAETEKLRKARERRSDATEAFVQVISSNEKQYDSDGSLPWPGYANPALERLRQGIGPEDIEALDAVMPTRKTAMDIGHMKDEEIDELFELFKQSEQETVRLVHSDDGLKNTSSLIGILNGSRQPADHSATMERPRPVVTYMWRDMFRRSVLNGHDILRYILLRYNVTVKVTTFEEPVQDIIHLLGHTDLLIGMHGAGWTNAIFLKRGAAALQLIPYGWRRPSGFSIRGPAYKNVVLSRDCLYTEWANTRMDMAFMRRQDFGSYQREARGLVVKYALHPSESWGVPRGNHPGNHWIYQNTYVSMETFAPQLDSLMDEARFPKLTNTHE